MLSAFGELFEHLCAVHHFSKRHLAEIAGVSPSTLTESLRDAEWAKKHGKRWYGPDLGKIDIWADAFHLTGENREIFKDLADLAHAPPRALARVQELRAQVKALGERIAKLEAEKRTKR